MRDKDLDTARLAEIELMKVVVKTLRMRSEQVIDKRFFALVNVVDQYVDICTRHHNSHIDESLSIGQIPELRMTREDVENIVSELDCAFRSSLIGSGLWEEFLNRFRPKNIVSNVIKLFQRKRHPADFDLENIQ